MITFTDKYRGIERNRNVPFINFTYETFRLLYKLIELYEYYYQLGKIYRIYVLGEKQTFGVFNSNK